VPTGSVARFDSKKGYGFVIPDEGGEDVFVHQNNIDMEGFRFLQGGERVSYEVEMGEKGMKAVNVRLLEPRVERPRTPRFEQQERPAPRFEGGERAERSFARRDPVPAARGNGAAGGLEQIKRRQERLINVLTAKGILLPGELDGMNLEAQAEEVPVAAQGDQV
jgi:CspA family cold shock protein